jgi:hypothetical protein
MGTGALSPETVILGAVITSLVGTVASALMGWTVMAIAFLAVAVLYLTVGLWVVRRVQRAKPK